MLRVVEFEPWDKWWRASGRRPSLCRMYDMRASNAAPFPSDALIRNVDVRDMRYVVVSDESGT
jgi:hypothetical protein